MPNVSTTLVGKARNRPTGLKNGGEPYRASLTTFGENVRVFEPIYCSKFVRILLPSRVSPVFERFSSPQPYRPAHCDFVDSTKSIRSISWSLLIGDEPARTKLFDSPAPGTFAGA